MRCMYHQKALSSREVGDGVSKVVVTGGVGFIGSNLAEALVEEGHRVVVVDDLSTGRLENLHTVSIELVRGSITDIGVLKELFEDVDCVFYEVDLRPSALCRIP